MALAVRYRLRLSVKTLRHLLCGLSLAVVLTLSSLGGSAFAGGPSDPPTDLTPGEPHVDFATVYSGVEAVKDSWFYYGGAIVALNGDMSRRGFLIQGLGGIGNYKYLNSGVPGGTVDGDITEGSGLIGYQFYTGNVRFRTFVGFDWQDNSLHPRDPANPVSGSQTGVVVTADLETVGPRPFYYDLYGSFASANDTYWSKVRVGYNFGRVVIGPEGAFYGDENFHSERAGAFIKFPLFRKLDVTMAGGFNFVDNNQFFNELGSGSFAGLGGIIDSGYGNVSISTWF
jgi:hypothetical protein